VLSADVLEEVPSAREAGPNLAERIEAYPKASLHERIALVERLGKERYLEEGALRVLREALDAEQRVLAYAAVKSLGNFGKQAAPAAKDLAALLERNGLQRDILETFRSLGSSAIREQALALSRLLDAEDRIVRFEALRTLAKAERFESGTVLERIVGSYERHERDREELDVNALAAYLMVLESFSGPRPVAVPLYARAVESFPRRIILTEDEQREIGHKELVRKLAEFPHFQKALGRYHEDNTRFRRQAAEALLELGAQAKEALPSVIRALEDTLREPPDYGGKTRIRIWLNRHPNERKFADHNYEVASLLCRFVGQLGEEGRPALSVLERIHNEAEHPALAEAARKAIPKIDEEAALETEIDELERDEAKEEMDLSVGP
jgi:hypothetical protein